MPPQPDNARESSVLDMERKEELLMEKKLRACRVNIIPRSGGYFREGSLPPPVSKRAPAPSVSPAAVEKATNPIALRYWNQCTTETKSTEVKKFSHSQGDLNVHDTPPWASDPPSPNPKEEYKPKLPPKRLKVPDITHRMGSPTFTPHDDPSPMTERKNNNNKTEVIKVLSTAGTGISRNNEVKEALGNINRFFTVDKIKKDDAKRLNEDTLRLNQAENIHDVNIGTSFKESNSYLAVKQEEIHRSRQRTQFLNNSENIRIPKSPRPFRELSLPRDAEAPCKSCRKISAPAQFPSTAVKGKTEMQYLMSDVLPTMGQNQKTELGLVLFNQLPSDTVLEVVAQQLSVMSGSQMAAVLGSIQNQAINTAVSLLFPRTNDDVKMSLITENLSRLSKEQKLDTLNESEEEIPALIDGLMARLGYNARREVLQSLLKREDNSSEISKIHIVPDIKIDDTEITEGQYGESVDIISEEEMWGWEKGEDLEYEFYELDTKHDAVGL